MRVLLVFHPFLANVMDKCSKGKVFLRLKALNFPFQLLTKVYDNYSCCEPWILFLYNAICQSFITLLCSQSNG